MTDPPPEPDPEDEATSSPDDWRDGQGLPRPGYVWTREDGPGLRWGEDGDRGFFRFMVLVLSLVKKAIAHYWPREGGDGLDLAVVQDRVCSGIRRQWDRDDPGWDKQENRWRGTYGPWLRGVCRNAVIDQLRANGTGPRVVPLTTYHAGGPSKPAVELDWRELHTLIEVHLSEEELRLFEMVFVDGLKGIEIARRLEITASTVSKRCKCLEERLRWILRDIDPDHDCEPRP
jgi:hypothetical protein